MGRLAAANTQVRDMVLLAILHVHLCPLTNCWRCSVDEHAQVHSAAVDVSVGVVTLNAMQQQPGSKKTAARQQQYTQYSRREIRMCCSCEFITA
jgi:hypothetical protein